MTKNYHRKQTKKTPKRSTQKISKSFYRKKDKRLKKA